MADTIVSGGGTSAAYDNPLIGYQPATRTGTQVAKIVRRQFGDESGVQLEDADIVNWINDAQDTIANRNRNLKARSRTYSIVGVNEYQLPNLNIEQVESLHYGGPVLPNKTFAQAEIDLIGREDIGEPEFWYEWGGVFKLFPTPPTAQTIELYYTVRPVPIVNLSDLLGVPDKYFQAIVAYCLQQAYEMDEDMNVSAAKGSQFDGIVNGFGEEERTGQHMRYERITIVDEG